MQTTSIKQQAAAIRCEMHEVTVISHKHLKICRFSLNHIVYIYYFHLDLNAVSWIFLVIRLAGLTKVYIINTISLLWGFE